MTHSVLITDDDDSLRQLLRMVLDRADGFEVVGEARDAPSCLLAVAELQPDVLLLDVGLPGRSGLEILSEVREVASETLVVVLSAHPAERMEPQALAAGAHAYLTKDDLVRGLVPALRDALRSRDEQVAFLFTDLVVVEPPPLARFAATAAHDLRASLLGVRTYADLLGRKAGVAEDPESVAMVGDLRTGAQSGLALVDDLQAYAEVVSQPVRPERIDLTVLTKGQLGRWPLARIEVNDLGTAMADPVLVRHLLVQLLDNAVRYAHPDRPVQVTVCVVASAEGDGPALRVEDNGVGVAVADRVRVLAEFERGSSAGATPGTGLGLAICVRVAQWYGGRVVIGDGHGEGTCVEVTLPHAELSGATSSAPLG